MRMSFIARYVYTYEEFVKVTNKVLIATGQDTKNNIQIYKIGNVQKGKNTIYNIDYYECTGMICENLRCK